MTKGKIIGSKKRSSYFNEQDKAELERQILIKKIKQRLIEEQKEAEIFKQDCKITTRTTSKVYTGPVFEL